MSWTDVSCCYLYRGGTAALRGGTTASEVSAELGAAAA